MKKILLLAMLFFCGSAVAVAQSNVQINDTEKQATIAKLQEVKASKSQSPELQAKLDMAIAALQKQNSVLTPSQLEGLAPEQVEFYNECAAKGIYDVEYVDADGVRRKVAVSDYLLNGGGLNIVKGGQVSGKTFPTTK